MDRNEVGENFADTFVVQNNKFCAWSVVKTTVSLWQRDIYFYVPLLSLLVNRIIIMSVLGQVMFELPC